VINLIPGQFLLGLAIAIVVVLVIVLVVRVLGRRSGDRDERSPPGGAS